MEKSSKKRALFCLGTAAYFISYICRLNLTAAMPEMMGSGSFTAAKLGIITSVYFVCYGVGQLFGGMLGDFVNSALLIAVGLSGSAVCNLGIFFFPDFLPVLILWAFNGIFQAMVWAPILKLFTNYYTEEEQVKNLTNVSVAMPLGTLAGYLISALVLAFLDWKYVFLVCGLGNLLLTAAIATGIRLLCGGMQKTKATQKRASLSEMKTAAKKIFLTAFAAVLLPIAVHGALKDGMASWTPTFLKERFGVGTVFGLVLTMIIPLFNMCGAYLSRAVYKKSNNAYFTACLFFALASAALGALLLFEKANVYLSLAFIVVVTTCMYAVNFIFISILPLGFKKYDCIGTASGILNSVAYLGTALSCFCLGGVLGKIGWTGVLGLWLGIALLAEGILIGIYVMNLKNKQEKGS